MQRKLATFCGIVCLMSMGLMSCASTSKGSATLKFPADLDDPYLTLEQIIEGGASTETGLIKRITRKIIGPKGQYSLDHPSDITVDSQGRLLIVDAGRGGLHRFVKTDELWQFDQYLPIPGIKQPSAIASGEQFLFISDSQSKKICVYDENLSILIQITDPLFQRPGDLSYDEFSKRLFISDAPAGKVYIYSTTGEQLGMLGLEKTGPGHLRNPISVTVDENSGKIFVLDGLARKVKIYNQDLTFISSFGKYDQVPGSFAFPKDIAQSQDGVLFVSDAAFGNIQMFDPSGALLFFFGENGTDPGQFLMPRNMYFDADQHLYVVDPYNNRVQVFQYHVQP